tara:strand:+ start:395 stop:1051 length:657 start_codon:yes stop_codon:yes gene_type:complete
MKKDILKNAKVGTRIFNQETGLYYVKTRKGTWQKDDNFFTGTLPRRLSTKTERDKYFSNQISEDGSFDLSKQGFTITNDHPLAEKLRSSEKVRVDVRDKLAIKRKEESEAKIASDRKTYLTNKIADFESKSPTFNHGGYRNLKKSENESLLTDLTKKYKDELNTLNKQKTSVTIDKNKDTSKVSAYEGTYLKPEKYTDKKDRDLSKDILNDLRKMGLN